MTPRVLIANRGEVAVRIARAASVLGWQSVAVYAPDDAGSLHVRRADRSMALPGRGAAAYLDPAALIRAAQEQEATHVHPGYGFLSENADFARACAAAGLVFVGPDAETLDLFGDKSRARELAQQLGIPVIPGTDGPTTLAQAQEFMQAQNSVEGGDSAIMLKACSGGGGRGMRVVTDLGALPDAFEQATREARLAVGQGDLYAERLVTRARHIEVQVLGDGQDVTHLWERDCTVQRRHQKLLEFAPAPHLPQGVRTALIGAALQLARAVKYRCLGTFEFLVTPEGDCFFIEANPRLQVEHTVTEAWCGTDLVTAQLRLSCGETLAAVGQPIRPADAAPPSGQAVQARVNMETLDASGQASVSGGTVQTFTPPSGPGVRVDTFVTTGLTPSPQYDALLAKVIVNRPGDALPALLRQLDAALSEFQVGGVGTNLPLLRAMLHHPDMPGYDLSTRWLDEHLPELVAASEAFETVPAAQSAGAAPGPSAALASSELPSPEPGTERLTAPTTGLLLAYQVAPGERVRRGQCLALVEAMKIEFQIEAPQDGVVLACHLAPGSSVSLGQPLLDLTVEEDGGPEAESVRRDLNILPSSYASWQERLHATTDEARPAAVQKRHAAGKLTARENVAALLDEGSFNEYGALALAAQRGRRTQAELLALSPADGLITGVGTVNAAQFPDAATCAVAAYDYSVMAGTQGHFNHLKLDRLVALAAQWKWPLVLFAEGGGGRPGDTDVQTASALVTPTFLSFAALSGQVPLVGVVAGYCFAGNAALLGCCDVVIATRDSSIGLGGPAMIEGGGLGVVAAGDIGPVNVLAEKGVVDLVADTEAEANHLARRYLSYFQGDVTGWEAADQRELRWVIPEVRKRAYDVRALLNLLADTGSVLELRRAFAPGLVTALVRIGGKAFGVIANDPAVLGGAIDAAGADKSARFLNLCDAHRLPLLSLIDTPGFMVGPDSEAEGAVRHVSRLFVRAAKLSVPFFAVVTRRAYGLGAQAMAAGGLHAPALTVSWPGGEFGPMGLEGAVRLGYRRELAAVSDPQEREALYQKLVIQAYAQGEAVNVAAHLEVDAVIDPAETRDWLLRTLRAAPYSTERHEGGIVDPW
ncbi:carbamoyl-phosphate synthase large subunit (plasmid) [Deinococcus wulumuqiensis]|uniref:acetyl-CoA carboxylase n=1 Tax=Deinococcus wulumuqiensis TaxID=980427 RepID=A0A345ILZ7_9DEIO|nr:carboxyl transferase domain-containing protein [Deinococcus wulumuqiensis]AXH00720.1 carbamoyl-phosphate synthase large subunit [Deinococcus wulumuqiensis]